MEDNDGNSLKNPLVALARSEHRSLYHRTTKDIKYAIAGTLCSILAVLVHVSEKAVLLELFTSLDQTHARQSIPVQALNLNVGEAGPGVDTQGYPPEINS